ncbi:MAG TPA: type II toxin-antitoxin system RelE/ParE family toxin [Kofleriaceae bacterium]|jgi:plasmid stabilization system protein ParE|nr:type II toxin-antitoxin system RelE/ParE family toxin [Kofleriaceae bacterium]
MSVRWTSSAHRDLVRLHGFLEDVDRRAAVRVVKLLLAGVKRIARHPRLGVRLAEFDPREVRKVVVGDYEVRYEVRERDLFVLRIWHAHEDR